MTSPSVLGDTALCLSQQLSGTVSNPTLSCNFGTYNPTQIAPPNTFPTVGSLSASTIFSDEFPGGSGSTFGALITADIRSRESTYITALLNANVSGAGYILKPIQVKQLFTGAPVPLGYANDEDFLKATFPGS